MVYFISKKLKGNASKSSSIQVGQKDVRFWKPQCFWTARGIGARIAEISSSVLENLFTIERFTESSVRCVKSYINGDSYTVSNWHDLKQCPSESVIRSWVRKFEAQSETSRGNCKQSCGIRKARCRIIVSEEFGRARYIKIIFAANFG